MPVVGTIHFSPVPNKHIFNCHKLLLFVCLATLPSISIRAEAQGHRIADSLTGYSSTQGTNGWRYGYYDGDPSTGAWTPADYADLTYMTSSFAYGSIQRWLIPPWGDGGGGYWVSVDQRAMEPSGTICLDMSRNAAELWPVRRWVSNFDGAVQVTVLVANRDITKTTDRYSTSGLTPSRVVVFANGVQRAEWVIPRTDGSLDVTSYTVNVCVSEEDVIDIAVDPVDSNSLHDVLTVVAEMWVDSQDDPTIRVALCPSTFPNHPTSIEIPSGGLFSSGASNFQWYFNSSPLSNGTKYSGVTTSTLTLNTPGTGDEGKFSVVYQTSAGCTSRRDIYFQVCFADFNCDGTVDFSTDLDAFVVALGNHEAAADLNSDNAWNATDYNLFVDILNSPSACNP